MLIGQANSILLIRKGTKEQPAAPAEAANIKENDNFIAKLPVISDHRLDIEIIAPKVDFTLQGDRYDLLDPRILMRLLGTLSLGSKGQRNETNVTLSRAVAKMMENRRKMIARSLEKHLARTVVEHPMNADTLRDSQDRVDLTRLARRSPAASPTKDLLSQRAFKSER